LDGVTVTRAGPSAAIPLELERRETEDIPQRWTSVRGACYVSSTHMAPTHDDDTLKRGTAELLALAQLEDRQSHGYEIAQKIAARSDGAVTFHVASLYPVLYRLERRGLIAGRWVEKAGQRRRRYYRLTAEGRKVLAERRKNWSTFMQAVQQAAGV
jgi:PadR family transcriptional regulator, regulatory protein PadR